MICTTVDLYCKFVYVCRLYRTPRKTGQRANGIFPLFHSFIYPPIFIRVTVSNSVLLSLPSERTLHDYTHWCSVQYGVHFAFTDKSHCSSVKRRQKVCPDNRRDEDCLVYRKHTGKLVGFCDLSTVNQELEELAAADDS